MVNFHWNGCAVVAVFECSEPVGDRLQVAEIVRRDHLALDNGEEKPHLVEPGGVRGRVDHDRVRECASQALGGRLTAVGRAVVDDPEHALGAGVGFLAHDLGDEVQELFDAGARLGEAEHVGAVDLVGGQLGQDSAATVGVVDAHDPGPTRWQVGVAAGPRAPLGHIRPERPFGCFTRSVSELAPAGPFPVRAVYWAPSGNRARGASVCLEPQPHRRSTHGTVNRATGRTSPYPKDEPGCQDLLSGTFPVLMSPQRPHITIAAVGQTACRASCRPWAGASTQVTEASTTAHGTATELVSSGLNPLDRSPRS